MFGENIILGQAEASLDGKNRIILPKFTGAEEGDKLVIVDEIDFLSIYSEEVFTKQIELLEAELNQSQNITELRRNNLRLLRYYRRILKRVTCDKYHKINLGLVKNNKNKIICIGAKDHLIIQAKK